MSCTNYEKLDIQDIRVNVYESHEQNVHLLAALLNYDFNYLINKKYEIDKEHLNYVELGFDIDNSEHIASVRIVYDLTYFEGKDVLDATKKYFENLVKWLIDYHIVNVEKYPKLSVTTYDIVHSFLNQRQPNQYKRFSSRAQENLSEKEYLVFRKDFYEIWGEYSTFSFSNIQFYEGEGGDLISSLKFDVIFIDAKKTTIQMIMQKEGDIWKVNLINAPFE